MCLLVCLFVCVACVSVCSCVWLFACSCVRVGCLLICVCCLPVCLLAYLRCCVFACLSIWGGVCVRSFA